MNDNNRDIAFRIHYTQAIESLSTTGCYWFNAARPVAYALDTIISEAGINSILLCYPPVYEFVLLDGRLYNRDRLKKLAELRYQLIMNGTPYDKLPVL